MVLRIDFSDDGPAFFASQFLGKGFEGGFFGCECGEADRYLVGPFAFGFNRDHDRERFGKLVAGIDHFDSRPAQADHCQVWLTFDFEPFFALGALPRADSGLSVLFFVVVVVVAALTSLAPVLNVA